MDHYSNTVKMVDNAITKDISIFWEEFPDCRAVIAFDNASNYASYASDALHVDKLSKGPGGA